MADHTQDPSSITILVRHHAGQIDLQAGLIPVEELTASLRRVGITHLQCLQVKAHRSEEGDLYEELELTSAF